MSPIRFTLEVLGKVIFLALIIFYFFIGCNLVGGKPSLNSYQYTRVAPGITLKLIPLYIDHNLGESDKLSLERAIDQWNYALNENIMFYIASWDYRGEVEEIRSIREHHGVIIVNLTGKQAVQHNRGENILAFVNDIGGWVIYLIRERIKNEDVTAIVLHEIGHILGAHHEDHDLMKPIFDPLNYRCIDYQTLVQVAKAQGFDSKRGNYCY